MREHLLTCKKKLHCRDLMSKSNQKHSPDLIVDPVLLIPMNEGRTMWNKVLAKFSSIPFQLHFLHHEFVIPRVHKPSHFSGSFCRNFSSGGDLGASVRQVVRPPPSIPSHQKVQQAKEKGGPHHPSIHPRNISANLRAAATRSARPPIQSGRKGP